MDINSLGCYGAVLLVVGTLLWWASRSIGMFAQLDMLKNPFNPVGGLERVEQQVDDGAFERRHEAAQPALAGFGCLALVIGLLLLAVYGIMRVF